MKHHIFAVLAVVGIILGGVFAIRSVVLDRSTVKYADCKITVFDKQKTVVGGNPLVRPASNEVDCKLYGNVTPVWNIDSKQKEVGVGIYKVPLDEFDKIAIGETLELVVSWREFGDPREIRAFNWVKRKP